MNDGQKHYDDLALGRGERDYEYRRWQANPRRQESFRATQAAVRLFIAGLTAPQVVLEVGPGPGTWTRLIHEAFPSAVFDLVDISIEMLNSASACLSFGQARLHQVDGAAYVPDRPADVFFSSRALEYVGDKDGFATMIGLSLRSGGRGCIITKTPHYKRSRLSGRKLSNLHGAQIDDRELAAILGRHGLTVERVLPVTFSCPLIRSAVIDRLLSRLFASRSISPLSRFFSESYMVVFHCR